MVDLSIEQALFENQVLRARSAQFDEAWLPDATRLIEGFGAPTDGREYGQPLFARPLGATWVAVVQSAWPRFRILVLRRSLYDLLHDPFAIADRFPPDWNLRGSAPGLSWPAEPLPKRTVEALDDILKNGDGPFLLGASQTLVDGGKICVSSDVAAERLFRDLWALLPDSVRRSIWPATFAFGNDLEFDLLAMPTLPRGGLPGYLDDEGARDYPESRYERSLQMAVESKDQPLLDQLLARKSTGEMIRLALIIIGISLGAATAVRLLSALGII